MTDKQKNITLIVGFLMLFLISYVFSIQKTIDLKTKLTMLQKEKELMANAKTQIFNLQQKNKHLDAVLQQKELSIKNSFQQLLFNKLNVFKKECSMEVISFNEPHQTIMNQTKLLTYSFKIKGSFIALLKLTNYIERQQLGTLTSVNFEKKRNYRRNKEELTGLFYLQKLEQQD
ncbi:MAG: hypothetical protein P8H93_03585 [Polaribacter sp.]|nr:hypothetical protein [Polaribacter sp.]